MRGTFEEPPTGLIPWFSKIEGNTYATIAASPFPLQGKPTQAQDIFIIVILLELILLHHVILRRYSIPYEFNTLDAFWIAIDVWSNSSRCRKESVY